MVHANCAELVLLQVNQIQPMDSELNVFLEIQVQLLVMDASITETSLEIAKHVEPIKLWTSTKTDVPLDQTVKLTNTMIAAMYAKTAKQELPMMLLLELAELTQWTLTVAVTQNLTQVLISVSDVMMVWLVM